MKIARFSAMSLALTWASLLAAPARADELPVVPHVDLARYMGVWYEIASLPNWFQKGCFGTKASYELRKDGNVDVLNSCHKGSLDGELDQARGVGRVVDPDTNAKLKVRIGGPVEGDYWIIGLAKDYSYAVVGTPDRDSLWVLSRQTHMEEDTLRRLTAEAQALGFDTEKLNRTVQP